jgi:hypothetical protein
MKVTEKDSDLNSHILKFQLFIMSKLNQPLLDQAPLTEVNYSWLLLFTKKINK